MHRSTANRRFLLHELKMEDELNNLQYGPYVLLHLINGDDRIGNSRAGHEARNAPDYAMVAPWITKQHSVDYNEKIESDFFKYGSVRVAFL